MWIGARSTALTRETSCELSDATFASSMSNVSAPTSRGIRSAEKYSGFFAPLPSALFPYPRSSAIPIVLTIPRSSTSRDSPAPGPPHASSSGASEDSVDSDMATSNFPTATSSSSK